MAIIAAAAAPIIAAAAGGAVDYARFLEVRQASIKSLDSASLGVATAISRGEIAETDEKAIKQSAIEMFALNMNAYGVQADGSGGPVRAASFDASFDPGSATVTADVTVSVPTTFAGLIGIENFEIPLSSSAAFSGAPGAFENIEFSFVLDVTGSMRGERLAALKNALKSSLNVLLPAGLNGGPGLNDSRVRVGFVPYATSVNAGTYHEKAVGEDSPSASARNSCVTEREGINAYTDVAPDDDRNASLYETDALIRNATFGGTIEGIRTQPCPVVPLRPLTNNRQALLADIDKLEADGATGGHMGIDWGINLLAQPWQDFWPEGSKPANYGDAAVRKVLVIMTDGEFNAAFHDADIRRSGTRRNPATTFLDAATNRVTQSRNAALQFCDFAKDEDRNIEVYTIAFDAGLQARNLLSQCATQPPEGTEFVEGDGPFFYDAPDSTALAAAFREIVARELQVLLVN